MMFWDDMSRMLNNHGNGLLGDMFGDIGGCVWNHLGMNFTFIPYIVTEVIMFNITYRTTMRIASWNLCITIELKWSVTCSAIRLAWVGVP